VGKISAESIGVLADFRRFLDEAFRAFLDQIEIAALPKSPG
jgi:hypothetical protein